LCVIYFHMYVYFIRTHMNCTRTQALLRLLSLCSQGQVHIVEAFLQDVIPPATIMQILTSAGVAYSVKCVFLHFFHEVHLVSSAVCVSVCECGSACVCLCVYVSIPPACSSLCFAAHTHTRNRNSIHTVHIPIKWQEPTAPGEVHAQLASAILHRRVRLDESSYQGRHEAGRRWHHSQRCRGRLNWCADCACVCVCVL
jgi:hypothetical protein